MDSDFDDKLNDYFVRVKGERSATRERCITDDMGCNCLIVLFSVEKIASAPMHLFLFSSWRGDFVQNYESELFHLLSEHRENSLCDRLLLIILKAYDSFSTIIFSPTF